MDILNVFTLLGGVAIFLFGMSIMGNGLEKMSGGRLERILEKMTSSVFRGVLLGCAVTAVIQSSSATTVMVVGFVNAGIMKLSQVVGVIMGANIGTTVTSMLLSLNDISAGDTVLKFFKPAAFAPILSVVGVVLYMFLRGGRKHDVGQILIGFGMLFFGMLTMEQSMSGLKDMPEFQNLMMAFTNPLLGVLAGLIMTAIIQSSSASVGILQALSSTGRIPFSSAAPIILGQNIGTCVTALLSSIGASKNAKRTALVHLYFNIIGSLVFLSGMYLIQHFIGLPFWSDDVNRSMIAVFHLTFNLVTTLLLIPFSKGLVWLASKTLKDDADDEETFSVLDERFLASPSVALHRAREAVVQMSKLAANNYKDAVGLLNEFDEKVFDRIHEKERLIDKMEVNLAHYLLKMTDRDFTDKENISHSELLHAMGDVERIGDYAVNVAESAQQKAREGIDFTGAALKEMKAMTDAVEFICKKTFECYEKEDAEASKEIEPLEEVIDLMTEVLKSRHIARLKRGECGAEAGGIFLEILINFERIADHCSNIALYVIQAHSAEVVASRFDQHEYVRHLHQDKTDEFNRLFNEYEERFLSSIKKADL